MSLEDTEKKEFPQRPRNGYKLKLARAMGENQWLRDINYHLAKRLADAGLALTEVVALGESVLATHENYKLLEVGTGCTIDSCGHTMIGAERLRQIYSEGYTAAHDDEHDELGLLWLALYYAMPHPLRHKCHCGASSFTTPDSFFEQTGFDSPFAKRDCKTPVQRLVTAGALIAAEIDRLQRAEKTRQDMGTALLDAQNLDEVEGGSHE